MKAQHTLIKGLGSLIVLFTLTISCEKKDLDPVSEENIPIVLKANINDIIYTRIANNSFESNDAVGTFVLLNDNSIQEDRYGDNIRFTRNADDLFTSDEAFYYPNDGGELQIISYYPYQEIGVQSGESTMSVSVSTQQNIPANYSTSDFLVAIKKNVAATRDAVLMNYDHKFSRVKISVIADEAEDLAVLLAATPKITVNGLFTKAVYDFSTDSFSNFSEDKSISATEEWKTIVNGLVGDGVILIPQELAREGQYVRLEIEGREYKTYFPSTLSLEAGKQCELEVKFKRLEDVLLNKLKGEINNWIEGGSDIVDSEVIHNFIDVSKLTFEHSDVYKVLNKEKQVAEICKEYLVTPTFTSQAIVAYPMKADDTVDLSKGLVIQLIGKEGKVHGGIASWDSELNALNYTPGQKNKTKNVYVLTNGQLALSISDLSEALSVTAISDIVRDVRGTTIFNYPIVKIGTQYWLKNNLHASLKRSGEKLTLLSEVTDGASGFLKSISYDNYFYTADIVMSKDFLPLGWTLPDWVAWNKLKKYINNTASVLKSGTWIKKVDSSLAPFTNLSGFNALPVAFIWGKELAVYEGKYVSYWALNASGTQVDEKIVALKSESDELLDGNIGTNKALPIRCIRK